MSSCLFVLVFFSAAAPRSLMSSLASAFSRTEPGNCPNMRRVGSWKDSLGGRRLRQGVRCFCFACLTGVFFFSRDRGQSWHRSHDQIRVYLDRSGWLLPLRPRGCRSGLVNNYFCWSTGNLVRSRGMTYQRPAHHQLCLKQLRTPPSFSLGQLTQPPPGKDGVLFQFSSCPRGPGARAGRMHELPKIRQLGPGVWGRPG